jgi:hypothetical protein
MYLFPQLVQLETGSKKHIHIHVYLFYWTPQCLF